MKVGELIKYLEKFDKNKIVGMYDIGKDSGNWYELNENEFEIR